MRLNLAAGTALVAAAGLVLYAAAATSIDSPALASSSEAGLRLALPAAERRAIFTEVVARTDSGVSAREACEAVALARGLDEGIVRRVAREGITRGWPRE